MDKRFRILAVDDEYVNTQLIKSALSADYDFLTALNGHEAIDLVKQHKPDLILLDVMMPDLSGFDVCRIIRADAEYDTIPIIFLTALDTREGQLQGLELGGIDYLTKPVNRDLLRLRVRNHLLLKEQRDMLARQKEVLAEMLAEQESQNERLREADETVRESEARFRNLLQNIPSVAVQGYALDGTTQYWNKASELLYGYTEQEAVGRSLLDLIIPPEMKEGVRHAMRQMSETGQAIPASELVLVRKDGARVPVFSSHAIVQGADRVMELFCLDIDITERKRAEEELVRSESELKAIYENSPVMMCLLDTERRIHYANPAFSLFTGTAEDDLKGLTACGVFHCVNAENDPRGCGYSSNCLNCTLLRSIEDSFQTGTTHHNKEHTITLLRDGEQRKFTLLESATLIHSGGHARLLIYLHDITEHKRLIDEKMALEQQFQQTQKLESLGVLAGGIAHDFNNILAIIVGYCALIKMDYEKAATNIPHIEMAAERAAALCRQMLAYAGKAQAILTQVNVTALVDEMVTMLKSTTTQNVAIISALSAELPLLKGDASQLRQIVMNLIINASEAIGEEQGLITISLEKTAIKAGSPEKDHLGILIPAGGYICLEVTDTGCGMDDETKRRIFEPFYSTKFTGRGLGMSATLGIITAHKGALQLSSVPGEGSTFKIYLPVQNSVSAIEGSLQQKKSAPWQGGGTILLVEDEEQVMLIVKTMLQELGFTVIEACNGREALELYRGNISDIILVVTDMGMPVMDGYALFRELKALNPHLPIIISSGYGDTVVTSRIPRNEIAGLVSKPFGFDQLRDIVQSVVEGVS
ncbi:MAG TPA: response regulator [Desulfuromonadales bacterium]|nr:response regulator [Desulfuromonadales bacterium]